MGTKLRWASSKTRPARPGGTEQESKSEAKGKHVDVPELCGH
jgi:hypothetical protein